MKAVADGSLAPTALGDSHLDHCLGCRRCEWVCPAGVEYGRLLVGARADQFERRGPPRRSRWPLALLARPRLLSGLLGWYRRAWSLLPGRWRRLPRPPRGPWVAAPVVDADAEVFVGCIARSYEGPARAALETLAQAAGVRLSVPSGQGCCGAAALHAGDAVQARRLAVTNAAALASEVPVLCLASGCQAVLAESLAGHAEVQDAMVFLAARGERLKFRDAHGARVFVHRPCTQFALPGSIAAMRGLLGRVPGLLVIELPDTGCCGAAGLHMVEFPERAERLRRHLLASFESQSALLIGAEGSGEVLRGQPGVPGTQILSASHGCRLHLAGGSLVPVRHPLEFLAEQLA